MVVKRTLGSRIHLVHVDAGGPLSVADIAMKSGSIRTVAVYAPNDRFSVFFSASGAVPDRFNRFTLNGRQVCRPEHKIDSDREGCRRSDNRSLLDLIGESGLVDR